MDKIVLIDTSMSLKVWKEEIVKLTEKYGENSVLYVDSGPENATLRIEKRDKNYKLLRGA